MNSLSSFSQAIPISTPLSPTKLDLIDRRLFKYHLAPFCESMDLLRISQTTKVFRKLALDPEIWRCRTREGLTAGRFKDWMEQTYTFNSPRKCFAALTFDSKLHEMPAALSPLNTAVRFFGETLEGETLVIKEKIVGLWKKNTSKITRLFLLDNQRYSCFAVSQNWLIEASFKLINEKYSTIRVWDYTLGKKLHEWIIPLSKESRELYIACLVKIYVISETAITLLQDIRLTPDVDSGIRKTELFKQTVDFVSGEFTNSDPVDYMLSFVKLNSMKCAQKLLLKNGYVISVNLYFCDSTSNFKVKIKDNDQSHTILCDDRVLPALSPAEDLIAFASRSMVPILYNLHTLETTVLIKEKRPNQKIILNLSFLSHSHLAVLWDQGLEIWNIDRIESVRYVCIPPSWKSEQLIRYISKSRLSWFRSPMTVLPSGSLIIKGPKNTIARCDLFSQVKEALDDSMVEKRYKKRKTDFFVS